MAITVWQGTVDNLELSGIPNGDKQPMRVVELEDGRLMTEFAFSKENDEGAIEYDETNWIADYQMRFRDMDPEIGDDSLWQRMIRDGLLEG